MGAIEIATLVMSLADRIAAYAAVVNKAKAEGRDVSDAEVAAAVAADDAAAKLTNDAIARKRAREAKK